MLKLKSAIKRCATRRISLLTPQARILSNGVEASRHASTSGEKTQVLASLIRYGIITPALIAASLSANADCTLQFTATKNGQSVLAPMVVTVDGPMHYDTILHSFNKTLPCGRYQIAATLDNVTRTRTADLLNNGTTVVTIEMGE